MLIFFCQVDINLCKLCKNWPTYLTYNIFLEISLIVPRARRSEIAIVGQRLLWADLGFASISIVYCLLCVCFVQSRTLDLHQGLYPIPEYIEPLFLLKVAEIIGSGRHCWLKVCSLSLIAQNVPVDQTFIREHIWLMPYMKLFPTITLLFLHS